MTDKYNNFSSGLENSDDGNGEYVDSQPLPEQTAGEDVDEVRRDLGELADELAYQLADQYITTDEPGSVLVGTTEDGYGDVISYFDKQRYEFDQLQHGSFQIQEVTKEDIGDLLRVIQQDNLISVVDKTDEPRSVLVGTTENGYGEVAEHWNTKGYTPEQLPLNNIHIPEMDTEDIDELMNMTGVESVLGSEPLQSLY